MTVVVVSVAAPADQNWPQWRGPNQTGVAPHADPPSEWSETKNVKWKFKIPGQGSATPVIWGNLVFVQSAVSKQINAAALGGVQVFGQTAQPQQQQPEGGRRGGRRPGGGGGGFGRGQAPTTPYQFTMTAVDRESGRVVWQKMLHEEVPHEATHQDGTFASASPICDGESVFAYFGSRGLYAMDMKGNVRWKKDLGEARIKNTFGEGSSPALFGNYLVVNWDHEGDDFIVAFDKRNGNELWRKQRDEQTSWTSPLIVNSGSTTQVVVNATSKVRSYDLTTGQEIWSVGPLTANSIPTAVPGNGMVYSMSGFRGAALFAVKLGAQGDVTGTDAVAFTYTKNTPYVPSPLLYDDRLYFFSGNNATLTVLDAVSGKPVIDAERLPGVFSIYASPLGAAGRVYVVSRDGSTLVLKKSDKVEVIATNKLEDRFDASPVAVGRELFLRGKEYVYCISATAGQRAEAR